MAREYLRIYKEYDIEEVKSHLLILGDLSAQCGACQEIGLDPKNVTQCSHCGAYFKFATSRRCESHPGERFKIARRFLDQHPEFTFIDFSDYDKTMGKKKVRDIFGD